MYDFKFLQANTKHVAMTFAPSDYDYDCFDPVAKSNVIVDVKPLEATTSIEDIEKAIRSIELNGLFWRTSEKLHIAYGIYKLRISCTIEDELVPIYAVSEAVLELTELVQSVDFIAINKA
uniref:EF1_GNE domain-containing protein n=1 Tax=Panagrellus redivivus TaxID=6233 RepID=A0A7E4W3L2_PANRE